MELKEIAAPFRTDEFLKCLLLVWENAVRETHIFLTPDDILRIAPYAETGMRHVERLIVACEQERPVAFIGMEGNKVEMLFVAPAYFSKGIGRLLMERAIAEGACFVDVNEQNPRAIGFYKHLGFEVFQRDAVDEMGNPFPILHMRLSVCRVREASEMDIAGMKRLFKDTVMRVNRLDYTPEEVMDWASCGESMEYWRELMRRYHFFVAENCMGDMMGFAAVGDNGYLHSMYVCAGCLRRGVATRLLFEAERVALELGATHLTADVSRTARPFFEKRGWHVVRAKQQRAKK